MQIAPLTEQPFLGQGDLNEFEAGYVTAERSQDSQSITAFDTLVSWDTFPGLVDAVEDQPPRTTIGSDATSESTTPCSLAFSIIFNHNRKGLDVQKLDEKLQKGYRGCLTSKGCSVDNSVLISVLAEIS